MELNALPSTDRCGQTLTYTWQQTAGPDVNLTNPNGALASFVPGEDGAYSFTVTVSNGIFSDEQTVQIGVGETVVTDCPRVDAGTDQEVREGASSLCLDGAGSASASGLPLDFEWFQIDGVEVEFSNPFVSKPCIQVPQDVCGDHVLVFELTVTEPGGCRRTDSIAVAVTEYEKMSIR